MKRLTATRFRKVLGAALLGVHGTLALWAAAGLVELVTPTPPWPAVRNPELPVGLLVVHWLAMLGAGSAFLVGYLTRWPATPRVMVAAYAGLAAICAVETFGHLTNESRFVDMGVEYTTYAILIALLHNAPLRNRFGRAPDSATPRPAIGHGQP
jgi:hypothetical protein